VLEDRAGRDVHFLAGNLDKFMAATRKRPEIGTISTTFLPSVPQQFVHVDREKVLKQGVALNDVYQTIQAFMGGLFINYFNDFGRTWQVYVQAEAPYRSDLAKVGQFYVRNIEGKWCRLPRLRSLNRVPAPNLRCAITSTGQRRSTAALRRLQRRPSDGGAGRRLQADDAWRNGF